MGSNRALWWRIVVVLMLGLGILVNAGLLAVALKIFSRGPEITGGSSLTFEIRSPKADVAGLNVELARQEKLLHKAKTPDEKKAIQGKVNNLKDGIARYDSSNVGGKKLAERMIEILKERIDPQGFANLEWRPVGANCIEVRMPAARAETRLKQQDYDRAMRALAESNVSRADRQKYLYATAEQRRQTPSRLTKQQAQALKELGEAFDAQQAASKAFQAARASGDEQKISKAQAAFDSARAVFREKDLAQADTNIRISRIEGILHNYRTPAEEAGLKETEKKDLRAQFAKDIKALRQAHPERVALTNRAVEAYKAWSSVRHRLSDPADLQRRIARAGVLEFRIVAGDIGEQISNSDRDKYKDLLQQEGPEEALRRGDCFAWFPIRSTDRKGYGGMVMAEYAGRWYMLLSNRDGYKMIRVASAGGWRLKDAFRDSDQMGRGAIGFEFDEVGAKQFYNLTSTHKGQCMAILLDDEVFSAPRIQSAISNRGQITGTFTREQIDENIRLLQAGSLPARIAPVPVSIRSFAPAKVGQWIGWVIASCATMLGALLAAVAAAVSAFRACPGRCAVWCTLAAALAGVAWLVSPGAFADTVWPALVVANAGLLIFILAVLAMAALLQRGQTMGRAA